MDSNCMVNDLSLTLFVDRLATLIACLSLELPNRHIP